MRRGLDEHIRHGLLMGDDVRHRARGSLKLHGVESEVLGEVRLVVVVDYQDTCPEAF